MELGAFYFFRSKKILAGTDVWVVDVQHNVTLAIVTGGVQLQSFMPRATDGRSAAYATSTALPAAALLSLWCCRH